MVDAVVVDFIVDGVIVVEGVEVVVVVAAVVEVGTKTVVDVVVDEIKLVSLTGEI